MEFRVPYFNLMRGEPEATYGAIVEILLKSRLATPSAATRECDDEDVNAYLAGVLFGYLDPAYQQAVRTCLATCDTDVFLHATRGEDVYHTYWVYKVNADDRLVDLGIFHPHRERGGAVLAQTRAYYGFASGFNHRLHRRMTAVSEILGKLSRRTEQYVSILNRARRDYLHMVGALSGDDLRELHQRLEQDVHAAPLRVKQDELLDVYAAWQRTADPALKAKLLALWEELRGLDPMFPGPTLTLSDG